MSPRKRLCTPVTRTGSGRQTLQQKNDPVFVDDSPKNEQPLKEQSANSTSQTVKEKGEENAQLVKTERIYVRNCKVNIPKASELLEAKEVNQDCSDLRVYTVYSKDVLLQKMSDGPIIDSTSRPLCIKKNIRDLEPVIREQTVNTLRPVRNPAPVKKFKSDFALKPEKDATPQFPSIDLNKEIWRESMVWKYFVNVKGGAKCKICNRILKTWKTGTLVLENHLFIRHRLEYQLFQKECTDGIGGVTPTMKEPVRTYSRIRKPLVMNLKAPYCINSQPADLHKLPESCDPLGLTLLEQNANLLLNLKSELPDLVSEKDFLLSGVELETVPPEVSSERLLAINSIDHEILETSNFGSFKKNSVSRLGQRGGRKALELVKDEPKDQSGCKAVLISSLQPYEHVKQEPVDTDVPNEEPENVDMIVPDPISTPSLPVWIKKEPEEM